MKRSVTMNENDKRQLIRNIDKNVNKIISDGGTNEDILVFLARSMDDIFKHIISDTPQNILSDYCGDYDGFSLLMEILQDIALITSKMSEEVKEALIPKESYAQKVGVVAQKKMKTLIKKSNPTLFKK